MGEARRRAQQMRLEQREGGHYVIVPLAAPLERVPAAVREAVCEAVCEGLVAMKGLEVRTDPASGQREAVWGPWQYANEAEVRGRQLLTMLADLLEQPREGPEVRPMGKGTFYEPPAAKATDPRSLGGPPADMQERLEKAERLNALAAELGADDLTILLAAYAHSSARGEHPVAFVQRARAAAQWCDQPEGPQTPLAQLEQRARDLAGMIANQIPRSEQFILVLSNTGPDGYFTHIGTMDRATTVSLLGEYVQNLRRDMQRLA